MRAFLCFLVFFCLFSLPVAGGKNGADSGREILFKRPLKKGDHFSLFARIDRSFEYTLALPGAGKPIERKDALQLSLAGILQIRGVTASGQAKKISLYISSVTGSRNGKEIAMEEWKGQELMGDLFPAGENAGTFFTAPGLKRKITSDELLLFRALFPGGPQTDLSSFTSPRLILREKEKFPLQFASLIRALSARKITDDPAAFSGEGEYLGVSSFRGIPCHRLKFHFSSRKVPGYDLRYQAEILLPEEPALGPSLQIYRNAREFIHKILSSSNQFAAGARLSQIAVEEASITLLPESSPELPGKKTPEKTQGFYQLLRPRK